MKRGTEGLAPVLRDYMLQRGLVRTAEEFAREMQEARQSKRVRSVPENLVSIHQGYQLLRDWLVNSLDAIRDELWPILWVVFVHGFLALIKADSNLLSREFFEAFRSDHEHSHRDEVRELSGITNAALVTESSFARRALRNRFHLQMRPYPSELLMSFLMDHELLSILNIVNDATQINIVQSSQPPSLLSSHSSTSTASTSSSPSVYSNHNTKSTLWNGWNSGDTIAQVDAAVSITSGLNESTLESIKGKEVKWFVPDDLLIGEGGATGAQANAKTHPEVPDNYKSTIEKKTEEAESNDKKAENAITNQFEMQGRQVNVALRMTKLDRHNMAEKKDNSTKTDPSGKKKEDEVIRDNHTAAESAHPSNTDPMLKSLRSGVIESLKISQVDPVVLASRTLGEYAHENARRVSRSVGFKDNMPRPLGKKLPWPSIALQTFFNSHDSLICVDTAQEGRVFAAGFDDSVCRVWYYPREKKPLSTANLMDSSAPVTSDQNGSTTSSTSSTSSSVNNGTSTSDGKTTGNEAKPPVEDNQTQISKEPVCEDLYGHSGPVYACSLSPDGKSLLTCSEDGSIRLWMYFPHLRSHQDSPSVDSSKPSEGSGPGSDSAHQRKHKKKTTESSRFRQGAWRHMFTYRSTAVLFPVWDVKFCPLGFYFASGGYDNVARVWCLERDKPLRVLAGHLSDVNCVGWHPNCKYLGTGSADKTIRVWDVSSTDGANHCVRIFSGHTGGVNCLAWTCSGRYLASGGQDKLVIIWDFAAGERMMILDDHLAPINSISISPSYDYFATGSADGSVRVYETKRIWGKKSVAYYLTSQNQDPFAMPFKDGTQQEKKSINHIPKQFQEQPQHRTFPTKFTPIHFVRFLNERLILASGSFALPMVNQ